MFIELFLVILAGVLSAAVFAWVFSTEFRSRLYSLECDLADLQERHLRSVRKASITSRWDKEAELDEKIAGLTVNAAAAKKEGWTKWGSLRNSSSVRSSEERQEDSPKADSTVQ